MTEKLNANELKWLRKIAVADSNVERRIPQLSLAKLLKFALVESRDMLTLRISRRGWKCLNIVAPERAGQSIPYALAADSRAITNLRVKKT
jgi:hypothetical protein